MIQINSFTKILILASSRVDTLRSYEIRKFLTIREASLFASLSFMS